MLALEVNFLTGRYRATAYNDRAAPEWPPHPARLFSALAAAHFSACEPDAGEREVLLWLERQGPPEIRATDADSREIVTHFVPVNDASVTGDLDGDFQSLRELRAGDSADDAAPSPSGRAKAKRLEKEEMRFQDKMAKAITLDRPTKAAIKEAARVLPEGRGRQPRTLPSVGPHEPRVVFLWPGAQIEAEKIHVLDRLASRVVRLGHSASLVSMRVVDPDSSRANWLPSEDGQVRLRTVAEGQLERLEAEHKRSQETEPRILPSRSQRYSPTTEQGVASSDLARTVFGDDWIILRRVFGPRLPATSAPGVARLIRKILVRFAEEPVPEIISGHLADASPSRSVHAAIVPLPFVGSDHADGSLVGIAIVPPRGSSREERRSLLAALGRWEGEVRKEQGIELDETDSVILPVHLSSLEDMGIVIEQRLPRQATLRSQTWCRPSRVWITASPIALDRNPGELRARESEKRAKAVGEAEESIRVAVERVGLPRPRSVTILPSVPLAGAAKARHYPPFPGGTDRHPRVLTHARIEFADLVAGPILVGSGRYHGLGLLRPVPDSVGEWEGRE